MKYHTEKVHPSFEESLRANEKPVAQAGDPITEEYDNREELRAALKRPGHSDQRVQESERDRGRTT